MQQKVFLFGASGHAKVIIDIINSTGKIVGCLFDDNESISTLLGYPVHNSAKVQGPLIISIGDNAIRKRIAESLLIQFSDAIISSTSIISNFTTIDVGTVIMQGSIIQSGTKIGKHCIINTSASVDHDCFIGDYVHVSPNATLCGNVEIGEGSWIGAGSVIIPGVKIGKWSIIGAGSTVTKDIPDNVLAVGNKCEIIKSINEK